MKQLGRCRQKRKSFGAAVNAVEEVQVAAALEVKQKASFEAAALAEKLATDRVDVTLPVRPNPAAEGRVHPVSRVLEELMVIFADMGFSVAKGPDIETTNTTSRGLTSRLGHPAREVQATFLLPARANIKRLLLRTHTSPRPGAHHASARTADPHHRAGPRVYRMDSDQTHTPMFHQSRGACDRRGLHMGHLKWLL